jgi:uncharacterized membrane protein
MSSPEVDYTPREKRRRDPARVLAFTDAVLAIVITILVLDLEPPDLSAGQSLADALEAMRPTFVAFVISFLITGMYWAWHRDTFANVRYANRDLVWLNLLFLLPASLIPFAASMIGEYPQDTTALHLYGAVLLVLTVMRILMDWYLSRHQWLLWSPRSKRTKRMSTLLAAAPLLVYGFAIALASTLPNLSLLLYFSLPILYFMLVTILKADPRTHETADEVA